MTDLIHLFGELRGVMLPYVLKLDCKVDGSDELSVDTQHILENKNRLWFEGVKIEKRHVSYHLMPVYVNPKLLEGISPGLRKRMHGKSCFSFTAADPSLLKELAELTEAGFMYYREQGYV